MVVLFLVACGGTYAVFVKYVVPMRQQLVEQEKEADTILAKIKELQSEFENTVPDQVIRTLQEGKQPWVNASKQRTGFFKLEEIEEIEIPEGAIARFWYAEKYPELEASLYEAAAERGILLTTVNFDVQPPSVFGAGTNPKRAEILEEVNKYNYGIQMAKFIFDAGPTTVDSVDVWPKRVAYTGRSGIVYYRTTGYKITIQYEDLLRFLQKISLSEYYITVEGIKITNRTLRDARNPDPVNVEIIITEAQFEPHKDGAGALAGGAGNSGLFNRAFGGGNAASQAKEEESSGFIAWLKKIIPFWGD